MPDRQRRPGETPPRRQAGGQEQDGRGFPAHTEWPGRFAQALAETLAGSRPEHQLVPWTTERVRERIRRLGPSLSSPQRPRVRRVVTFHPTEEAMEMTVVVGFGSQVRALAVRLERSAPPTPPGPSRAGPAPGWLCTAVEAA